MKKTYNTLSNVGTVRHVVNFHDGKKTHADGSPFFDVRTFSNAKDRERFLRDLRRDGYQPS